MDEEIDIPDWQKTEPIERPKCSQYKCEKDLHSFRRRRPGAESYRNGSCIGCGVNPIDWPRLDKRDINDVEYTFKSLNNELVRHYYLTVPIDQAAISSASRKGLSGLREWIPKRLVSSVGLPSSELFRDGMQTPTVGNVVFYAQHATACCCRKCMEEWHGKDRETTLEKTDIGYFTDLILSFVKVRLPSLPTNGLVR